MKMRRPLALCQSLAKITCGGSCGGLSAKNPRKYPKISLITAIFALFRSIPAFIILGFLHNFAYTNLRISPRTFPLTLNGTMVLHQLQLPYKSFSVNGNNARDKCVQKIPG